MKKIFKKYNMTATMILLISSILMVFPFVWMVLSAFKTRADVLTYPPRWLPSEWSPANFKRVLEMIPFFRYFGNSLFVSISQTLLQTMLSVAAAYSIAILNFPGKKFINTFFRSSMFIPSIVTMIPLFFMVNTIGLIDTYAGIILPQIFSAFTIMLFISFFSGIPKELIDAALIDGCGYFKIMFSIVVPNSRTGIATGSLFAFLGYWKSYMWPLLVTNRTSIRTLPIGLKYLIQESNSDYELMMAAALMAVIPLVIFYLVYEKELVKSLSLTGIK